jgi:hypothetical protein
MIPSSDIVLNTIETPLGIKEGWNVDEVTNFYQGLVAQIDIWKDPFFLIKKKCPSTFPPAHMSYHAYELQYLAFPFPESKIRSVSFERETMNNLILGPDDVLYQLLYTTETPPLPKT